MLKEYSNDIRDIVLSLSILFVCALAYIGCMSLSESPYEPLGAGFFPKTISIVLALLSLILLGKSVRNVFKNHQGNVEGVSQSEPLPAVFKRRPGLAGLGVIITILYISVLYFRIMGFRISTVLFGVFLGTLLSRFNYKNSLISFIIAVVMGLGLHYIFTNVFIIDLP